LSSIIRKLFVNGSKARFFGMVDTSCPIYIIGKHDISQQKAWR
jgi:hypothetical protein